MKRLLAPVLIGILVASTPLLAQSSEEKKPDTKSADAKKEKFKPTMTIVGFVHADADVGSGPSGDEAIEDSTFLIRRARFGAKGKVAERWSYQVVVALDANDKSDEARDVNTYDAFLDYKSSKGVKVRLGQFKYNFDLIGKNSGTKLPMITRPAAANGIVGRLGRTGGSYRDVGVELSGKKGSFGYTFGMLNGNGINHRDDNGSKDLYARFTLSPASGLTFGAAYYTGDDNQGEGAIEQGETITTIDMKLEKGDFALIAGFYQASFDNLGAADTEPTGFYVTATRRINSKAELAARIQNFDSDSNKADLSFDSIDLGFNYYLVPKGRWGASKLQFNYMIRDAESSFRSKLFEERGDRVTGDDVKGVFLARLQIKF